MEVGCCVAGGKSCSSAASASVRPCSRICFSIATQYNNSRNEKRDARRRPFCRAILPKYVLGGGRTVRALAHHRPDDLFVAGLAYVRCALVHGIGPDLIVGQAVRGYDAKRRKFAVQIADRIQAQIFPIGCFQIQHQHAGTMPRNGGTNFFIPSNEVDWTEMFGKTNHQSLSSSGVGVIDNQANWFHKSPLNHRGVRGGLWLRQLTATTGVYVSEREQRYLRNAFSVGGSNGSAWSLPFCFSRISTFPSASSSCLRQVAESCMPSSNRVRDFSSGTSPFSSSSTIFSNRSRHSSNFANHLAPVSIVMPFGAQNVQQ